MKTLKLQLKFLKTVGKYVVADEKCTFFLYDDLQLHFGYGTRSWNAGFDTAEEAAALWDKYAVSE